jgi:hypothetical protein
MIDRIVLTKLSDPAARHEVARLVKDKVLAVSGLAGLQVGLPGDAAAARSWDVSLVLSCETAEGLDTLLASRAVAEVLELLEARGEFVKAWSFERID